MTEEEIPDLNIFMMCLQADHGAFSELPEGYTVRSCRPDELHVWKAFPFDNPQQVKEYDAFMTNYFHDTYSHNTEEFFQNTLFVCDQNDQPVATCATWKAYGKFNTIHWFKTLKTHEGKGIGRALFSIIMQQFKLEDYPVFLHTQPGSFRAVKLYADFGFRLLSGEKFGTRINHTHEYLPILKEFIPANDFQNLKIADAPAFFIDGLKDEITPQF